MFRKNIFTTKLPKGLRTHLTFAAAMLAPVAAHADPVTSLARDLLVKRFTGENSTGDQAEATHGEFTQVSYKGCPVQGAGFPENASIMYEERNFFTRPVHYQRLLVLVPLSDNQVEMKIHTFKNRQQFLGTCSSAAAHVFTQDDIAPSTCSQFYTLTLDQNGRDTWTAITQAGGCPSQWFPGSTHMTSQVEIAADGLIKVWGKFFDDAGNQVGGVTDTPYIYKPVLDSAARVSKMKAYLTRMSGTWTGSYERVDALTGQKMESMSYKHLNEFDGQILSQRITTATKSETAVETKVTEQTGAITLDGRLVLNANDGSFMTMCRLQSEDALYCVGWYEQEGNNKFLKEIYVLQSETERTLTNQWFDDDKPLSFGYSLGSKQTQN